MLCVSCGKITDSTDICEHCKSALPSRKALPPYQNGPLVEITSVLFDWDGGKISKEELCERLEKRKAFYQSILSGVCSMEVPPDVRAEISEELRVGRMGLESLLCSIDLVDKYAESGDSSLRDSAVRAAESGTRMLNRAILLNWESYTTLQASTEEMLALARESI
ncbi:MAG: hypothetical protein ACI38Q_05315 [Candidatus Bruticola sp.]